MVGESNRPQSKTLKALMHQPIGLLCYTIFLLNSTYESIKRLQVINDDLSGFI